MDLVEAPDHAGPAAPPHAPERLRTLLAEGSDARTDETVQSEKGRKQFFSSFEIDYSRFLYSESKVKVQGFEYIFAPGVFAQEGRKFLPCGFLLSLNTTYKFCGSLNPTCSFKRKKKKISQAERHPALSNFNLNIA